jgi:hypothetical protein
MITSPYVEKATQLYLASALPTQIDGREVTQLLLYRIGSRDSRVRDRHTQLTQPVVRAWQSGRGSTAHYAVAYNGTTPHTIHKVYQLGY